MKNSLLSGVTHTQLLKTILATFFFTIILFVLEFIAGDMMPTNRIVWYAVSNFLIVILLSFYVIHCVFARYKLLFSTFTIFYIIGNFNIVVEGFIFGILEPNEMARSIFIGVPFSLLGSLIVIYVFNRWHPRDKSVQSFHPRTWFHWGWRILLANFTYIVFYLIAGILIQTYTPGFVEFYADKWPTPLVFFMTNMFFRGFVFVAIAILIDRSLNRPMLDKAVFIGFVFSVIGGIAPLIPPSDYMPQFIRIAHGLEIGVSNFLYGATVFLLIRSRKRKVMLHS